GGYPGSEGATSGYLIEEGNEKFLLDCGSGILSKIERYTDLKTLNNVVLSHYHSDHIADVGCLQYASKVQMSLGERNTPVTFYGHNLSDFFNSLNYDEVSEGKVIEEGKALVLGSFTLNFKRTPHPVPSFAIRIETKESSLGYTGDTGWDKSLPEFFEGVDLLLCEASLYNKYLGVIEGHLTAGESGKMARESKAKRLILTHFPHSGDHGDLKKEAGEVYNGEVSLAEVGKVWEI
ncbi:MAG: MBL fold metallo-hydrolase, partial [Spirochaetales bacterium]|nr:MBL fold metallo-hydrolase [Spirochaetales bacterium]